MRIRIRDLFDHESNRRPSLKQAGELTTKLHHTPTDLRRILLYAFSVTKEETDGTMSGAGCLRRIFNFVF
jgi:hypothetical protein